MGVNRDQGLPAETLYRTIATKDRQAAWLALMPLTGRTHQLRAHLSAIGHPILGDGKYGGDKAHPVGLDGLPGRLLLHARELALPHPEDGTTLRITAPLPAHMTRAWAALGFDPAEGEGVSPQDDE
jgi:23S rRNA pseudouridine955/2504/2580 synthase